MERKKREKVPFVVEVQQDNGTWLKLGPVDYDSAAEAEKAIKKEGCDGSYRVIQVRRGPYTVEVEKIERVKLTQA